MPTASPLLGRIRWSLDYRTYSAIVSRWRRDASITATARPAQRGPSYGWTLNITSGAFGLAIRSQLTWRYHMTTTPSTDVAITDSMFSETERFALAGFLAGYRGLTRDAHILDLRQFATWCQSHNLRLFDARRADIECFARHLEELGRTRATVARRLSTVAGFYRYAEQDGPLGPLPGRPCPPSPVGLRVARHRAGPQ